MCDVFSPETLNQNIPQPQMQMHPVEMPFMVAPPVQTPVVGSPPAGPNVLPSFPPVQNPQLNHSLSSPPPGMMQPQPGMMPGMMQQQMIQLPNGQIQMQAMMAPPVPQMQLPGGQMVQIQQLSGQQMFYPMMQQPIQQPMVQYIQMNTPQGPVLTPVYIMPDVKAMSNFNGGHPPFMQQEMPNTPHRVKMSRSHSNTSFDGSDWSESLELSGKLSLNRFHSSISSCSDGYGSDYEPKHRHRREMSRGSLRSQPIPEEVDSPTKMFDPDSPQGPLMDPFDSLLKLNDKETSFQSLERTKGRTHYECPSYLRRKQPTSKERREELFKTELCNAWVNGKKCRFQDRCIFAHGQAELRTPPRKMERNRYRPPVQKHITSLLNKITEDNFGTITTEFLSACVEGIHGEDNDAFGVVRALFTKACIEESFRHIYASIWRKLLNIHPLYKDFERQMFELCLCEYGKPRNKRFGLGCMCWIAELVSRNEFNQDIVKRILDDMYHENPKEMNVELWCKLCEHLGDTIDTSPYFERLAVFKESFGTRIRFMIMDLEDLRSRNWMPR